MVDFDTPHAVAGIGLARICARVTKDSVAHEPVLGVADEIRGGWQPNEPWHRACLKSMLARGVAAPSLAR